jgi:hypothetical protein
MKIIGLRMIFRRRRKVTGKSNIFAAEIHGRNGFNTVSQDFSGERCRRDTGSAFYIVLYKY